jgi:hypothetical protein
MFLAPEGAYSARECRDPPRRIQPLHATFNRAEEALHEAYRQTDTGGVRAVYRRADGRHEVRDRLATEPDLVMEALVLNGAILPKPADLAAVTAALAAFWRAA